MLISLITVLFLGGLITVAAAATGYESSKILASDPRDRKVFTLSGVLAVAVGLSLLIFEYLPEGILDNVYRDSEAYGKASSMLSIPVLLCAIIVSIFIIVGALYAFRKDKYRNIDKKTKKSLYTILISGILICSALTIIGQTHTLKINTKVYNEATLNEYPLAPFSYNEISEEGNWDGKNTIYVIKETNGSYDEDFFYAQYYVNHNDSLNRGDLYNELDPSSYDIQETNNPVDEITVEESWVAPIFVIKADVVEYRSELTGKILYKEINPDTRQLTLLVPHDSVLDNS